MQNFLLNKMLRKNAKLKGKERTKTKLELKLPMN